MENLKQEVNKDVTAVNIVATAVNLLVLLICQYSQYADTVNMLVHSPWQQIQMHALGQSA
jgi:hypothetical protein